MPQIIWIIKSTWHAWLRMRAWKNLNIDFICFFCIVFFVISDLICHRSSKFWIHLNESLNECCVSLFLRDFSVFACNQFWEWAALLLPDHLISYWVPSISNRPTTGSKMDPKRNYVTWKSVANPLYWVHWNNKKRWKCHLNVFLTTFHQLLCSLLLIVKLWKLCKLIAVEWRFASRSRSMSQHEFS